MLPRFERADLWRARRHVRPRTRPAPRHRGEGDHRQLFRGVRESGWLQALWEPERSGCDPGPQGSLRAVLAERPDPLVEVEDSDRWDETAVWRDDLQCTTSLHVAPPIGTLAPVRRHHALLGRVVEGHHLEHRCSDGTRPTAAVSQQQMSSAEEPTEPPPVEHGRCPEQQPQRPSRQPPVVGCRLELRDVSGQPWTHRRSSHRRRRNARRPVGYRGTPGTR